MHKNAAFVKYRIRSILAAAPKKDADCPRPACSPKKERAARFAGARLGKRSDSALASARTAQDGFHFIP